MFKNCLYRERILHHSLVRLQEENKVSSMFEENVLIHLDKELDPIILLNEIDGDKGRNINLEPCE